MRSTYLQLQLFLIFIISIVAVSLSGQEEPKEDPPRDEVIVRSYDTQRYFQERRWNTGSGSDMPMREDIDTVIEEIESKIKSREQEIKIEPVTISLVFHMMNAEDPETTQRSIQTQIEALNRDFNNRSPIESHPNDPEGKYTSLAASTQITFTIAEKEVAQFGSGVATFQSSEDPWTTWDQMKDPKYGGAASIEPSQYLNIWVCDLPADMGSYSSSMYCIDKEDGIVIDGRYFGTSEESDHLYNEGKTLTHLTASYFGIKELWDEYSYCNDDKVRDTPIHYEPNYNCIGPDHSSACQDYPIEMTMNFMDATPDDCQGMFTEGQVRRMHASLQVTRQQMILKSEKGGL